VIGMANKIEAKLMELWDSISFPYMIVSIMIVGYYYGNRDSQSAVNIFLVSMMIYVLMDQWYNNQRNILRYKQMEESIKRTAKEWFGDDIFDKIKLVVGGTILPRFLKLMEEKGGEDNDHRR